MNIFDMFKEFEKDDTKSFTNGWNTIMSSEDSYELIINDKNGNRVGVIIYNWNVVD